MMVAAVTPPPEEQAMTGTTAARRHGVVGNVTRGCLGNLVEWFDWFVYATFSIYFAAAFFPADNPTAQLLSTSVVFAVGFLMRPLGGWLLGLFADQYGRRAALSLSVTMMSAGSLIIACTPTHATIGIVAPIVLVLARLLQGLSVGGEFGSSATYLSEVATPGRRGFYSSFQYVSIVIGQLLALTVLIVLQQLLPESALNEWAWRIPFVVGAALGFVVLYLRRTMDESEHYKAHQAARESSTAVVQEKLGMRSLLSEYPRQLFLVFCLAIGGTVSFYAYTTYMTKYMVNTAGIGKDTAALISFVALFLFMLLQPVVGGLSDRIGRRPIMFGFSAGIMIATVPIFTIMGNTTNTFVAFSLMVAGLAITSGYTALAAIVKAELFPTKIRALGVGMPHALVAAVFGGTTESVALGFKSAGIESAFFWYVVGCASLTLIATFMFPESKKRSTLEREMTAEHVTPPIPPQHHFLHHEESVRAPSSTPGAQ
jgi:MFS transporter, MHS family, alpha-ketoglutarate permease